MICPVSLGQISCFVFQCESVYQRSPLCWQKRRRRGAPVCGETQTYLREAADEPVLSTGAVLAVLAVVEGARVAHGHALQTDVELRLDAAPQAVAAAGELNKKRNKDLDMIRGIGLALREKRQLTMLMKAERQTMTMVRTPTRVLFILDWTIPLERVCRGTGKSCSQMMML